MNKWSIILGIVAYSLVTVFVFATIGGAFDAQASVSENPAVMDKAKATIDDADNSSIPFKILRQGQNSFYGVDALIGRDSAKDFGRPKIFVATNHIALVRLWKNYIDRDCKEFELNPLGNEVAVFIFRGVQDSNLYTMTVDGVRLPAPASGPIIVDVTFSNPNFETYSYPKKFCSPFIVMTIDKESLKWLGEKKVRVFVSQVSHQILDAEEVK